MNTGKTGNVVLLIAAHIFVFGWFYLLYRTMTSAPNTTSIENVASYDNQNGIWLVNVQDSANQQARLNFIDYRVEEMMSRIPWNVRNAVLSVEIFDFSNCGISNCHTHPDGRICMSASVMQSNPEVFYHEFGHARHLQLNRENSNFEARWRSIQGGALHEDLHQDVAQHVMHAYKQLLGQSSIYDSFPYEPSYRQKFQLLREYNFIPKY